MDSPVALTPPHIGGNVLSLLQRTPHLARISDGQISPLLLSLASPVRVRLVSSDSVLTWLGARGGRSLNLLDVS